MTPVEVKPGSPNQSSSPARRRTDAPGTGSAPNALQRALNWGQQDSDIELNSQTPESIEHVLQRAAGKLQLVAADSTTPPPPDHLTALLHPQYTAQELREKCRRLVIESALVKNRHEKQLYLAVGLLNWSVLLASADSIANVSANDSANDSDAGPDINEPDQTYSSALLFYPVRLITESAGSGLDEVMEHLLYIEDSAPEPNLNLRSQFFKSTGINLPVWSGSESLSAFLDQVENTVQCLQTVRLDRSMALGLATANVGRDPDSTPGVQQLQKLPAQFRYSLARGLIKDQALEELQATLSLLNASNDYKLTRSKVTEERAHDIASVREFSNQLTQFGLGHIDFNQLPELPDKIAAWATDIEPALGSVLLTQIMTGHDITAVQLMKLAGIIELIDKAPENIHALLHRDLAYRGTHLMFKRARHQAQLIQDELAQLQQHFHLDRLPAKSQLLQLIEELGGAHNSEIEVIDSHYFNARRQFMDFSTDKPTTLSTEHKRLLNKLVKVLRFRELFVNNTEYRMALGPTYRGLKTDWAKLEQVLDYAQELRQVLGSAAVAAMAIDDWHAFRDGYIRSLAKLQKADAALRGLLQVTGATDQSMSVKELLVKAKLLTEQLRNWSLDQGLIKSFANKNADNLLHLFTGKSGVDARTEILVRKANNRIQDFLLDGDQQRADDDNALQQVNETIAWLHTAVNTESVSISDILHAIELGEKT